MIKYKFRFFVVFFNCVITLKSLQNILAKTALCQFKLVK